MKGKLSNRNFTRRNSTRSAAAAIAAAVTTSVLVIPAASPASAQSRSPIGVAINSVDSTCKHNGRNYIVRQYFRGVQRYTLRCGTTTWGWKHIKLRHGWNAGMDGKINNAIANGAPNGRGGFSIYTNQCPPVERFRTIIGTPAGLNDVLTAYNVTNLASARKC
ncbi:hypothetical protein [Streptomyces sp. YGL11-2]|uniref:hypothetical protein n=1 Tax=Streptomyces sp. YGL11-2 TaxID=3414028 RepID=UPI003CF8512D